MIKKYWYYLGSNKDIEFNLYIIKNKINSFNDNNKHKYTISINNIYISKYKKSKYWLQLEIPSNIKNLDIKFKKYRKRLFSMDKFLEYKEYHKEWNKWTII